MAAGDTLIDSDGNMILDADGNTMIHDGVTDECCCGCGDCGSGTNAVDYHASFPGTFSTTSVLGFCEDSSPSETTFELQPLVDIQCQHGVDGGLSLVVDGKFVNYAVLLWATTPCDPPGTCPHWVYQMQFSDHDCENAGPFFYWSPDTSDPDDPTGTYNLVCASYDAVSAADPSTYTAPATIDIT